MENINIVTNQDVVINYKPAGIGERLIAAFLDYLIKFVILIVFILIINASTGAESTFLIGVSIIFTILILAYDLILETIFHGQSFGKKLRNIKVVKIDGSEPSFYSYFIRWLFSLVDVTFSSGAVAIVSISISKNHQRIGDIAAKTTVVKLSHSESIDRTIFTKVYQDYSIIFPEVNKLNDSDLSIVKEVLELNFKLDTPDNIEEINQYTYDSISNKMGISPNMNYIDFFRTILKDYNKYMEDKMW